MNPTTQQYIQAVYQRYHADDQNQADRLNRWRSIEPESAELLSILLLGKQAQRILEIGTSGGYSTLWLADAAAQTDGSVISLDIDAARQAIAQQHLQQVGLAESGAILVVDNVVSHAEQVQDFIALVHDNAAFAHTILPIGAGLLVVVRK